MINRVFEVKKNRRGRWFWHEVCAGKVVSVAQAYASKSNAKRAAKRKALATPHSTWKVTP